jgi:hypothetical protein
MHEPIPKLPIEPFAWEFVSNDEFIKMTISITPPVKPYIPKWVILDVNMSRNKQTHKTQNKPKT